MVKKGGYKKKVRLRILLLYVLSLAEGTGFQLLLSYIQDLCVLNFISDFIDLFLSAAKEMGEPKIFLCEITYFKLYV